MACVTVPYKVIIIYHKWVIHLNMMNLSNRLFHNFITETLTHERKY